MPLDESPDSTEEAVHELQKCPPEDLRRARRHHRRAIEALKEGCYDALGEETRDRLMQRLHADLTVLNQALDAVANGAMNASADDMSASVSVSC